MKKTLLIVGVALLSMGVKAQVGINAGKESSDPVRLADDAVLHVANKSGEHKGVLLPSVSLGSKTDQSTTSGGTVTAGLMVWNDGKGGLSPAGYYYWDGTQWVLTGNVENSNNGATNLEFVKGTIKNVDGAVPASSWDDNTFTVVGTGAAKGVSLPDPSANPGRIISFRNQSSSLRDYIGLNAPDNNSTIEAGSGHLLQSDGTNWYVIAGF